MRRILLALALATTVGLTAACADDSQGTNQGAAPAGSSAAASPSVDLKANTDAVCTAVVAAYEKEKAELVAALTELIAAGLKDDAAALAAAKAKGAVVLGRLTKAANAEIAKAADPQAKAALEQFVVVSAKVVEGNNIEDDAYQAELDKVTAAAAKFCPGLAA